MGKNARRTMLLATGLGLGAAGTRQLYTGGPIQGDPWPGQTARAGAGVTILNDASELSPTPVRTHQRISADPGAAVVAQLRQHITDATAASVPVLASTARHSMGGQSLPPNGVAVSLEQGWLQADTQGSTYQVAAGMRWRDVITRLDAIGFSPAVMQSNNDFGVASTFCVNAHGWPVAFSGFGSTVRSLRLVLASGEHVTCSPTQNAALFNMTMGGYGLTGIITDLIVDMVPNQRLVASYEVMPAKTLGKRFAQLLAKDAAINMAYGRLDISIDDFFSEALLITYRPAANQEDLPAAAGSGWFSRFSRHIFRAQLASDTVKGLRWSMEKNLAPRLTAESVTRNSLLNEPVVTLDDRDPARTDILHEYFVEPERFAEFVAICQQVIPSSFQELLNITLRYVAPDEHSVLSYASKPRIAAVMLFSQEKSRRGEVDMMRMTSELIGRVLDIGGSYYLPYRLHASRGQFELAYGRAAEFTAYKRSIDPGLSFRHALWDKYLAPL